MLIKMLVGMAGADVCYCPGQVVDIPEGHALEWIQSGIAAPESTPAARETTSMSQPENTSKKFWKKDKGNLK